ncbi:unnamed protein product [Eruca vesicaria subsp. sativa]|uniref:THO1-MOS11 C-terminal domain-containing protein n=1 Tax=Eruca vesicaria subsp. sativa TaxID=29727 RepID=A0ABC8LA51_ERUVS|nr:unnamed protein product [Eruca vesicaria subsp. sativa]
MASNGVKDTMTTTAENGLNPKKILDLNSAEPDDDILDGGGEVKGLSGDSTDEMKKKKDEADSKKATDSGDVSPVVVVDDDVQKKIRRAERFGVSVKLTEEEKRNSRAERFGTVAAAVNGSEGTKKAEELKRKARADRFGVPASSSTTKVDNTEEEAKKKARLARFGKDAKVDSGEEERRKARALRFSSDSSSELPGKLNIGKEAAGNAA